MLKLSFVRNKPPQNNFSVPPLISYAIHKPSSGSLESSQIHFYPQSSKIYDRNQGKCLTWVHFMAAPCYNNLLAPWVATFSLIFHSRNYTTYPSGEKFGSALVEIHLWGKVYLSQPMYFLTKRFPIIGSSAACCGIFQHHLNLTIVLIILMC